MQRLQAIWWGVYFDSQFTDRKTEAQRIKTCPGLHLDFVAEVGLKLRPSASKSRAHFHRALRIITWVCVILSAITFSLHTRRSARWIVVSQEGEG